MDGRRVESYPFGVSLDDGCQQFTPVTRLRNGLVLKYQDATGALAIGHLYQRE